MNLRPYQKRCSDAILNEWREANSTLAVMATGLGKTVVAANIASRIFPMRTLFLAHRQELIWQAAQRIHEATGLRCDVEMGEHRTHNSNSLFGEVSVIVSSIQTQCSGGDGGGRMGKFNPMDFGCLICDESHHATAHSWKRVIDYYRTNPNLKILGITATPDRADEEALGQVFQTVAFDYDILDGINDGWLVPINQQMVNIQDLDFSQVGTTAGDLNGADLAKVMEAEKNLHGVAGATLDIIGDRRTLVFTSSVKHAEMLADIFNRHRSGMAAWVCGKTPEENRRQILRDFASGKTQVVANCACLTEGFDNPGVEVVVQARPTKSRALYAQQIGRSTRPLPGLVDGIETAEERKAIIANSPKPSCTIIDFVGNSGKHKLMTTADILGGNVDDEIVERAIAQAKIRGKSVRMDELLKEEEEKRQQEREARRLAEEARKAKIVAQVKWSSKTIDPFDTLGVTPLKPRGWDTGKVISEKMRNLLLKQGIDPDKHTYSQNKQLIGEIIRRWEGKLCSFKQAKVLRKYGYQTSVSYQEAKRIIDNLAANRWRKAVAA